VFFRNASPDFVGELASGNFHTSRASWMLPARDVVTALIPDFVIPFSDVKQDGKRPLFHQVDPECVECSFDLPLSILLTLSRFEEGLPTERDVHGRFPGSKSVAHREGFLNRPIVDEYGVAFEQALQHLLPAWRPAQRKLRVKLSHDVDDVGIPLRFRTAVGHAVHRRHPAACFRDLFGGLIGLTPTYLQLVEDIARISLARGLDSAVYWKASPPSRRDIAYNPRHPKVRKMVSWLQDHGVETGVHPGYYTFLAPDRLRQEVESLRQVLGPQPLGGRQHFLRWSPETWVHWEACNLAYDSTLGYADQVGFRAGTCIPYRPWLLSFNREAELVEIPLLVMDNTLVDYMGLTPLRSLQVIFDCLARCHCVGGVFTLLWHPRSLIVPDYDDIYGKILDRLAGHEKFDWKTPGKDLY
jgi:hypothetical protein